MALTSATGFRWKAKSATYPTSPAPGEPLSIVIFATDHADGTDAPSGYTLEEALGYPWAQASLPGLEVLSEAVNPSTGGHALVAPSESLSGYAASSLGVYGYPRFVNTTEAILSLSAGGVTVESNKVAGGWRWSGTESSLRTTSATADKPGCILLWKQLNAAGDGYFPAGISAGNGSPVVRFENQGTTQITRAVPLNWDPTAARQFQPLLDLRCAVQNSDRGDEPGTQRLWQ